ncbi:MAG TPA: class I SAM-dependent methyltransferase [Chloroflexia bacterium]|nr:class I SAM-dependent methyltransferase [Chloroflexia bacterium]
MMNLEIATFLLSTEGRATLHELTADPGDLTESARLATVSRLRRRFSPEEAAGLLEVATARVRAAQQNKFSRASEMFFTKTGLEQSSSEAISTYRAERYTQNFPPGSRIADLGCGIGGDSLGLAYYQKVTGVDLDSARLLFARANAAAYGISHNFDTLEADITDLDVASYDALFFDPARRTAEGRRIFSVEDYAPPLSIIKKWLPLVPNIGVKIAPGVNYAELSDYDCEVEIISENGDVKEAVLWFGRLRSEEAGKPVTRRATLLPERHSLTAAHERPEIGLVEPQAYLYEPDGAVIRAGVVEELAASLNASKLDENIAFLTSVEFVATPFARAFRVIESMPFNLKKLSRRLNELKIGRVTVKKRGSPLDPQELERALKLKGSPANAAIVVLTHVLGVHYAIICEAC